MNPKILKLILLFIFPILINAQEKTTWDFAIKPGSEEWKNLSNETERFQAQHIPENILSKISTCELVKSCINLPSFGYYTAFNDIQTGFVILAIKFNGLKELSKREDAFVELLEIYRVAGELGFKSPIQGMNSSFWTIRLGWIELMLSQKSFLEQGKPLGLKELMNTCIEKYNMKNESNNFSSSGVESTLFLMVRILDCTKSQVYEQECLKFPDIKEFSRTSVLLNPNISSSIINLSLQFVNN